MKLKQCYYNVEGQCILLKNKNTIAGANFLER